MISNKIIILLTIIIIIITIIYFYIMITKTNDENKVSFFQFPLFIQLIILAVPAGVIYVIILVAGIFISGNAVVSRVSSFMSRPKLTSNIRNRTYNY